MSNKEKFSFVNRDISEMQDVPLTTKQVTYYQDAWNRFKKNQGSIMGTIIIGIILLFTVFGPMLKIVTPLSTSNAGRMRNLTPKIPIVEKLGIFDGTKKIEIDDAIATELEEYGEGIVLKVYKRGQGNNKNKTTLKVDHYKYMNYLSSVKGESGNTAKRYLKKADFEIALERNAIIEVYGIIATDNDIDYEVRVDLFKYALNQSPEDTYFWFGTTDKGLDLFTELWKAARISIMLATLVTVINVVIGAFIGAIIGYYGGIADILFDRIVDVLSGLPFIALLTIVVLKYGTSILVILFAFITTGWIGSYGRTRMQFYRFKGREYVLAARTLGAKDGRIMFKHIMPNAIGTLITSFSLSIPAFMFGEATYSYLGIIKYDGVSSIGELLSQGQSAMQRHPHLLLFPAIYISVLMLSFNLLGNGLRDAFNPSLRGAE